MASTTWRVLIPFVIGQTGPKGTGSLAPPPAGEASFALPAQLTDFSNLPQWWENVTSFLTSKGVDFATNLFAALLIFVVGRWTARLVTRVVGRLAMRAKIDETLVKFATNLVYAAMLAFAVLSALNRLGVDTTSFTAVVAAAGLAIGFALQGSLSNFAAGVLLIIFKPFKLGDQVTAGGAAGTVEEIQIFNTLIRTETNSLMIVPNSAITTGTITNHSAERVRRIDVTLRCSYDNDLLEVKRLLTNVVRQDERILQLPPPVVAVDQLADNAVVFVVQSWVRTEFLGVVRTELLESIKLGFERQGLRMAAGTGGSSAAKPTARAA